MCCRYTLQASTFQMALLLQFNTEDLYTVQQLTDSTHIKTVSSTHTHTDPVLYLLTFYGKLVLNKILGHPGSRSLVMTTRHELCVFPCRTFWFRFYRSC